jgi:type II secretory pathway pseudopilin PulG
MARRKGQRHELRAKTMNLSTGPHHKILNLVSPASGVDAESLPASTYRREGGYTLVALLALMTVLAIFALAAAPNIRRQDQREKEVEAIFRGEQIADAIRSYYSYNQSRVGPGPAALPTSMEQLVEGIPSGTKKIQVLRASAARDPLTPDGEWRLIRPRSAELSAFTQSLMLFAENVRPPTRDPQLQRVEGDMAPAVIPTLGIAPTGPTSMDDGNSSGPFIGVSSRSNNASLITYYGIEHHNEWIFTPLFR